MEIARYCPNRPTSECMTSKNVFYSSTWDVRRLVIHRLFCHLRYRSIFPNCVCWTTAISGRQQQIGLLQDVIFIRKIINNSLPQFIIIFVNELHLIAFLSPKTVLFTQFQHKFLFIARLDSRKSCFYQFYTELRITWLGYCWCRLLIRRWMMTFYFYAFCYFYPNIRFEWTDHSFRVRNLNILHLFAKTVKTWLD